MSVVEVRAAAEREPGNHCPMAEQNGEIIACHECDRLHWQQPIALGAQASCCNCGALLYRELPHALDRALACYLAALVLFVIANAFPFIALEFGGRLEENRLISGGLALYQQGMGELGLLVFLTSIVFPFVTILGMLYLLIPARMGHVPPAIGPVYRVVHHCLPWSLLGVFLLGTLVAVVKLQAMANVVPGVALFAFAGTMLAFAAARASFDPRALWAVSSVRQIDPAVVRTGTPLVCCHVCGLLRTREAGLHNCPRCGSGLHHRKANSIQRTWALVISAGLLFIPANVYPIMEVIQFGQGEPDTIVSGITRLMASGLWGLGLIVLFVSIVVPVAKLASLAWLLHSVQQRHSSGRRDRTRLYRITEVVGSWSMLDVFLVGLLSGLVSLDVLATVRPGIGATFFAGVVILTMFAAASFDPRLIWDTADGADDASPPDGVPA